MVQDLKDKALESGWWDESFAANLVAEDDVEGLAILVAVGCGLATSRANFVPAGLYLPRPRKMEFWLATKHVELAQRMANAWARQHPRAIRTLAPPNKPLGKFDGIEGGQSDFDPMYGYFSYKGDDGHRLTIAGPEDESPKDAVLLALRSEGLLQDYDCTTWRLTKNKLNFLTLLDDESGAFVQCTARLVDDGQGNKVLCAGMQRNKLLDELAPYLSRRAFYGEILGQIASRTLENLKFERSLSLNELMTQYRAKESLRINVRRRPGQWRRKVMWPYTDAAVKLRQDNPQTLGRIKPRLPTTKHLLDTLRDGKLFGRWLSHSGGWRVIVERPRMREACIIRIRPPRKA